MKRYKEPIKTALLLLLTVSAVFLAWKSGLPGGLLPERKSAAPPPEDAELSFTAAALPAAAVVTGPSGLCYGVKYDDEAMRLLCEGFSALLAETLGSAEAPVRISERTWRARLASESLCLDYGFPLPIAALAAWIGVETPWAEERCGTAFLLDGEEGSVRLSYRAGSGRYYECATAASWTSLRLRLEDYLPNGAAFAFSWDSLRDCEPDMLVLEQLPELRSVQISAAQLPAAQALAERFGINLSSQSRYTEADGTVVYPGEAGVLRLSADGNVSFSADAGRLMAGSAAERIEASRRLLEAVHEAYAADESLRFAGAETDAAGHTVLQFAYYVNGMAVELSAADIAAAAVWKDGSFAELSLCPRSYRLAEKASGLLPEKQAAAAAGSLHRGAAAKLILCDGGEEYASPMWIVTADGGNVWTAED